MITVYSDRIEIFQQLHISEKTGRGVTKITEKMGKATVDNGIASLKEIGFIEHAGSNKQVFGELLIKRGTNE